MGRGRGSETKKQRLARKREERKVARAKYTPPTRPKKSPAPPPAPTLRSSPLSAHEQVLAEALAFLNERPEIKVPNGTLVVERKSVGLVLVPSSPDTNEPWGVRCYHRIQGADQHVKCDCTPNGACWELAPENQAVAHVDDRVLTFQRRLIKANGRRPQRNLFGFGGGTFALPSL